MKLLRAEPAQGLVWIRRSFQAFRSQPFGLAGLFALCALVAYAVSWVPLIGGALLPVLAPAGSLLFMIATSRVEAGEKPLPGALAMLLGAGRPRLLELLKLGVAYLAASVVAMLIFWAFDGGATESWMDAVSSTAASAPAASAPASQAAPQTAPLPDARVLFSSLLRLVLLALLSVPFWHAPAIVYWGRQGFARSLVFSTMAIWRNRGAFAVFGLGWLGLSLVFAMVFSIIVALLGVPQKPSIVAVFVFVSAISFYLTLMYTSLWFTVTGCFAIDDDAAGTPPPLPKETSP
jgi:hypothetical protein